MSIIFQKKMNEIRIQQAVYSQENLPKYNNIVRDTRYVKDEKKFYMYGGYNWQAIELVLD